MKKIFNEKLLHRLIMILIVIQPLIDLDYLAYDWLNQYGLPRPSTIIRFLLIPLLIIWSFALREKNKKRVFIAALIYGAALAAYFVLHVRQAQALYPILDLTDNFRFSSYQELTYILTLVLPFGITYCIYHEHFDEKEVRDMTLFTSAFISILVVVGDLYVFADSTYEGKTVGNVFSWFSGIYDWYHPRKLASKFFFEEGNTIGILLFMILPMLYLYLAKAEKKKERRNILILIIIQSAAMMMLSTRVATYGALLVPVLFLVLYLADTLLLKKNRLQKKVILSCAALTAGCGLLFNWTPAVQNQKVDAVNDVRLLHNGAASEGMARLEDGKDLIPGTPEYINFYVFMFETYGINARYIQTVPSMYYIDYYNYQHDPKFWTDVCFMDVYDRVNGRQIETIFYKYKYKNLTFAQKFLGMGYSTFMNGSIVLEQDFVQQIYTLGYIGELLCIVPWLAIMLYGLVMFIRYRKKLINLENVCLVLSMVFGFGSAYLSGHFLDQFITTVWSALVVALLLNRVNDARKEAA